MEQVRPAEARGYLLRHGWKPIPQEQPNLDLFEPPGGGAEVVAVPLAEQGRDYVQRVIELITGLARFEGRYAVEVLSEILQRQDEATNGVPDGSPTAVPR